jgi:hypothetical protein
MLINNRSHNNVVSTLDPDDISGLLGVIEIKGLKRFYSIAFSVFFIYPIGVQVSIATQFVDQFSPTE